MSEALRQALVDAHPLVRPVAALCLGERPGPDRGGTLSALVRALDDPRRVVRMAAAFSLLNLGVSRLPGDIGRRFEDAKVDHLPPVALSLDDRQG